MDYKSCYEEWLSSDELTSDERERLTAMTDDEIRECFYAPLEFGTAGMRGIIDLRINRIKRVTGRRAPKGLADFVK